MKSIFNPLNWFKGDDKKAEQMGLLLGLTLFIISLISFITNHPERSQRLATVSALIAGIAIAYPRFLIPLEKILRNLVLGLAWLNTKFMLVMVYYFLFTPVGMLLKLFGKKLLEKEFRTAVESYFEKREEDEYNPERDELQF